MSEQNHPFTPIQRRTLDCVLDEIIPPHREAGLAGAGELGVGTYVEQAVRQRPELAFGLLPGLDALAAAAAARGAPSFAELTPAARREALREVAVAEPGLVPTLMFLTYSGYYHDTRVVAALGLEPRPPHPLGYELPPNDLTLLDPVRGRAKMFRDIEG